MPIPFHLGEMSVGEMSVGEMPVGEMPVHCTVGEMPGSVKSRSVIYHRTARSGTLERNTRSLCYKNFYGRNLRIFVLS
jgi:hypothetical protein